MNPFNNQRINLRNNLRSVTVKRQQTKTDVKCSTDFKTSDMNISVLLSIKHTEWSLMNLL